jgi:putative hydrolase of the HAD superfamily
MNRIKNIIFDFGHVILNINWQSVRKTFESKGFTGMDDLHNYLMEENYYYDLETGRISPTEFRDAIRRSLGNKTTDKVIDEGWNSMILDIPKYRVELLEKLKSKYNIYLLSNSNRIHWEYFDKYFADTYGYDHLSDLFKAAYYSHEMGLRKPDPQIYKVVMAEQGLIPEETLFIDDMIENIKSARNLNIFSYHLVPEREDIVDLFDAELEFTGVLD